MPPQALSLRHRVRRFSGGFECSSVWEVWESPLLEELQIVQQFHAEWTPRHGPILIGKMMCSVIFRSEFPLLRTDTGLDQRVTWLRIFINAQEFFYDVTAGGMKAGQLDGSIGTTAPGAN